MPDGAALSIDTDARYAHTRGDAHFAYASPRFGLLEG